MFCERHDQAPLNKHTNRRHATCEYTRSASHIFSLFRRFGRFLTKPNTQDCVRCRGMGSLAAPFIPSPLERLEGPSFAPCGGYGGLGRFWLGLCLSAPRREVTPGTWLAEPFARWQARSLPCQRSGPGRTTPGSDTDAKDTQNDNKTPAQVSNSARRFCYVETLRLLNRGQSCL